MLGPRYLFVGGGFTTTSHRHLLVPSLRTGSPALCGLPALPATFAAALGRVLPALRELALTVPYAAPAATRPCPIDIPRSGHEVTKQSPCNTAEWTPADWEAQCIGALRFVDLAAPGGVASARLEALSITFLVYEHHVSDPDAPMVLVEHAHIGKLAIAHIRVSHISDLARTDAAGPRTSPVQSSS